MAAAAVVSVSMGVMKPVLAKLTTLMGDEYKKIKGLRKEVTFLQDELSDMDALLEKMDSADELNPLAKKWRRDIIEMSYNIEDCIDDFMQRVGEADNKMGILHRASHYLRTFKDRHQLASQFQEIKKKVMEASERRKRYMLDQSISISAPVTVDPRLSALYKDSASLVGIDTQKTELVNWAMTNSGQQLKVMAIVGFGGLGKTTLANEVYREVGGKFDCKAFVSVSQKPTMTTVLNGLLSKLQNNTSPPDTCGVEELITKLNAYLHDKRYLIVVDDLWGVQCVHEWEHAISCALPQNNKRSRVIVTTRDACVSRACSNNPYGRFIYNTKSLSGQDSRKLFFNRIFGSEVCPTPELKDVSDEILKKCSGLPLAILTIASILACEGLSRSQKMQWEFIKQSLASKLPTNNPTFEGMMHILNLSYKSLPRDRKQCFLYLGMFPEDYEITKDELVIAWVAEGFVRQDMAESYFNELVNRSMIEPVFEGPTGEVFKCKVHDMMLDLILRRCEEDNFISVLHNPSREVAESLQYKVRRLSVNLRGVKDCRIPITFSRLSHLRCLSLFGTSGRKPLLSEFKFLRMLFIEMSWPGTKLDLTAISQLSLLRYLKVKEYGMSIVLPGQIQRLRHLEVFELPVSNCNIPSDIVDLPCLSHLTVPTSSALPEGISKAKSLQTMHVFCLVKSSSESIKGLGELTKLQKLSINTEGQYPTTDRWMTDLSSSLMTDLSSSLEKLNNLKELTVDSYSVHFCADAMRSCPSLKLEELFLSMLTFSRVPTWMGGLRNLRELSLGVMQILQQDVDMMGTRLPSLVHLILRIVQGVTAERIVISGFTGFSVLKVLHLDWDGMSSLTFEAGAMPNLQKLLFEFTPPLGEGDAAIPAGLQHLPKLKQITARTVGTVSGETQELIRNVFQGHAVDHPNHPAVAVGLGWPERCPEVREDGQ